MNYERSARIYNEYDRVMEILANGSVQDLETASQEVSSFPHGRDVFIHRHWIRNAVDCGSKASIDWMLSQGVQLDYKDDEGYTILQCAIERSNADKYEALEALLKAGAPINAHGVNDWTAAHMAAVREDIESLKLLIKYGADLNERTRIDSYATPLEEARELKKVKAVEFLEGLQSVFRAEKRKNKKGRMK